MVLGTCSLLSHDVVIRTLKFVCKPTWMPCTSTGKPTWMSRRAHVHHFCLQCRCASWALKHHNTRKKTHELRLRSLECPECIDLRHWRSVSKWMHQYMEQIVLMENNDPNVQHPLQQI